MEALAAEIKTKLDRTIKRLLELEAPTSKPVVKTVDLTARGGEVSYESLQRCLLGAYSKPIERDGYTFLANLGTEEDHETVCDEDTQFFFVTMLPGGRIAYDSIAPEATKITVVPPGVIEAARALEPGQSVTLNSEIICDSERLSFSENDLSEALVEARLFHVFFFGTKDPNRSATLTLWCPK